MLAPPRCLPPCRKEGALLSMLLIIKWPGQKAEMNVSAMGDIWLFLKKGINKHRRIKMFFKELPSKLLVLVKLERGYCWRHPVLDLKLYCENVARLDKSLNCACTFLSTDVWAMLNFQILFSENGACLPSKRNTRVCVAVTIEKKSTFGQGGSMLIVRIALLLD